MFLFLVQTNHKSDMQNNIIHLSFYLNYKNEIECVYYNYKKN